MTWKITQIIVKKKKFSLFGRQFAHDVYNDTDLKYSIQHGHLQIHTESHATKGTYWYAPGQWLEISTMRRKDDS